MFVPRWRNHGRRARLRSGMFRVRIPGGVPDFFARAHALARRSGIASGQAECSLKTWMWQYGPPPVKRGGGPDVFRAGVAQSGERDGATVGDGRRRAGALPFPACRSSPAAPRNCSTSGEVPRLSTWRGGFESRAVHQYGDVAQPRERPPCKRKAVGWTPTVSTRTRKANPGGPGAISKTDGAGLTIESTCLPPSRCSAAGPARLLREQEAGGSNPPGETIHFAVARTQTR